MGLMKLQFTASSRHLDQALKTPESMAPASSPISSVSAASGVPSAAAVAARFIMRRRRNRREQAAGNGDAQMLMVRFGAGEEGEPRKERKNEKCMLILS